MVLERNNGSRPWQRMVLSRDRDALCLMDETGSVLAEASTLPALLDAVDGGVAEPAPTASPVLLHGAAVLATACAAGLVSAVVL